MTIVLALASLLPQLAVSPQPAEVGVEVVVRAADGKGPVVGLAIELEPGDGREAPAERLGATDANGELRWTPVEAGSVQFAARHDGVRWVAPLRVVAAQPRWAYAAACTPLGLLLLWRALRRDRSSTGAA